MELQQLSNLITQILKQSVGLQHICREDFILNMKGMQYPFFIFFFLRYYNIWLNQRYIAKFSLFSLGLCHPFRLSFTSKSESLEWPDPVSRFVRRILIKFRLITSRIKEFLRNFLPSGLSRLFSFFFF